MKHNKRLLQNRTVDDIKTTPKHIFKKRWNSADNTKTAENEQDSTGKQKATFTSWHDHGKKTKLDILVLWQSVVLFVAMIPDGIIVT